MNSTDAPDEMTEVTELRRWILAKSPEFHTVRGITQAFRHEKAAR